MARTTSHRSASLWAGSVISFVMLPSSFSVSGLCRASKVKAQNGPLARACPFAGSRRFAVVFGTLLPGCSLGDNDRTLSRSGFPPMPPKRGCGLRMLDLTLLRNPPLPELPKLVKVAIYFSISNLSLRLTVNARSPTFPCWLPEGRGFVILSGMIPHSCSLKIH